MLTKAVAKQQREITPNVLNDSRCNTVSVRKPLEQSSFSTNPTDLSAEVRFSRYLTNDLKECWEFWSHLYTSSQLSASAWNAVRSAILKIDGEELGDEQSSCCETSALLFASIALSQRGRTHLLTLLSHLDNARTLFNTIPKDNLSLTGLLPSDSCCPAISTARQLQTFVNRLSYHEFVCWLRASTGTEEQELHPNTYDDISFATYNVCGLPHRWGLERNERERYRRIGVALAQSIASDLVALQEMWDPCTEEIIKHSEFAYAAASPRGLWGKSGLVTLSRHPIIASDLLTFSDRIRFERFVKKGILYTGILHSSGHEIDVYNLHLVSPPKSYPFLRPSEEAVREVRCRQIEQAASWINRRRRPEVMTIVLGDCNAEEGSLEYSLMQKYFGKDLYRQRHPSKADGEAMGFTWEPRANRYAAKGIEPPQRLDYMWATIRHPHAIETSRIFSTADQEYSDHYGVQGRVRLFREQNDSAENIRTLSSNSDLSVYAA